MQKVTFQLMQMSDSALDLQALPRGLDALLQKVEPSIKNSGKVSKIRILIVEVPFKHRPNLVAVLGLDCISFVFYVFSIIGSLQTSLAMFDIRTQPLDKQNGLDKQNSLNNRNIYLIYYSCGRAEHLILADIFGRIKSLLNTFKLGRFWQGCWGTIK
ncbi:hypothetical protein POM88_016440 [Heracleum sosnowskyi]|uniref:Uncharacterized protein n=1 Tax=Heracleum sosnowskyi TaxID=360622 RepID=A0AAD8MXE4_9APIA|nr:hypothetical protein POM88_016440 [Heracleum sosnowskyi]